MLGRARLWIDVVNPSDAFFFSGIIPALPEYDKKVTFRERAETVSLANSLGIEGVVVGSHHTDVRIKPFSALRRLNDLNSEVNGFDCGLAFENTLSVALCKFRGARSILFCDNDLKFVKGHHILLGAENAIRVNADMTFVPAACKNTMERYVGEQRLRTYNGYKEDVYIAGYNPDPTFPDRLRAHDYVTIRPEAMSSTYVKKEKSLVPGLLKTLMRENLPTVYLPRDRNDIALASGFDVIIPTSPLNGLDLCYHSAAVLTGSGTMAREAACMDRPAISFFPSDTLLSVDRQLVDEGRMLHSRNPEEIVSHVLSSRRRRSTAPFERAIAVRNQLVTSVISTLKEFTRQKHK